MNHFTLRLVLAALCLCTAAMAQTTPATIQVVKKSIRTYPFSDPDPIPRTGIIYPYFRFDGYTDQPVDKSYDVVMLENQYLKVMVMPEVGGKIWAITDKTNGKEVVYNNHVVKFRDIAMRGPWTSGGIEANYGIIGHTPNTATSVDYFTRTLVDGSVSCFIGTLDLLTQTYWTLEINLPADKAYVTTKASWHNGTALEQPYYTWMNVGMPARDDLEFAYPGNQYLGHGGEHYAWPRHENGKDLRFYAQNNFGPYKSYHVFGTYTDFFGTYYHRDNVGMVRYATHDEKPGKKIWIWGLSQQGMIWDKLLTDTDGQYVEVQSGRLFNQTAGESTLTPFKHRGFSPYATDSWTEYWYPVHQTKGIDKGNPFGAIRVTHRNGWLKWAFSPTMELNEFWHVSAGEKVLSHKKAVMHPLQPYSDSIAFSGNLKEVVVSMGGKKFEYHADPDYGVLERPTDTPAGFDWETAQGYFLKGKELARSRSYKEAEEAFQQSLKKDPHYLPSLTNLAMLRLRDGDDSTALAYAKHGLSIDTYDPETNFLYGLAQASRGHAIDARDGFDIASSSSAWRSAATLELARSYFGSQDYAAAEQYLNKSLAAQADNLSALELHALLSRVTGHHDDAQRELNLLLEQNPLNHFARFEKILLGGDAAAVAEFKRLIRHELPEQTYLQLAIQYASLQRYDDALAVLQHTPAQGEVAYWVAWLKAKSNQDGAAALKSAIDGSVEGVFPFRVESIPVMKWAIHQTNHWKPRYLLALLFDAHHQQEAAAQLLKQCGEQPDFAPFYAYRASFGKATARQDLEHAAALDPGQWRYGKLLVQFALDHQDLRQAETVSTKYFNQFRNDFRIRLLHAKVLLLNSRWKECLAVLRDTKVLPFEGATESRQMHHEAQLMVALDALTAGKTKEAFAAVAAARTYPTQLGAGQPYPEDRDERLEDFVSGLLYLRQRNEAEALRAFDKSVGSSTAPYGTLMQALSLRARGKGEEGSKLLEQSLLNAPQDPIARWSQQVYLHQPSVESPAGEYSRILGRSATMR